MKSYFGGFVFLCIADFLKKPSTVQLPSQAIPGSTKLVNDSVIAPDTTPGNGRIVGKSDSIQKAKH